MARWLVEREGERFDLDEYPYSFPSGEIFSVADGEKVFLVGDASEMLQVAGQVRERALQAVDELSAVIAILWPGWAVVEMWIAQALWYRVVCLPLRWISCSPRKIAAPSSRCCGRRR